MAIEHPTRLALEWTIDRSDYITAALEYERVAISMRHQAIGSETPSYLLYSTSVLSEMPICRALIHIEPPDGFQTVTHGSVIATYNGEEELVQHVFFFHSETDTVLCFTSGQFVDDGCQNFSPGGRIAWQKALYPEGIYRVTNQVYALFGPRMVIRSKLGIFYIVG